MKKHITLNKNRTHLIVGIILTGIILSFIVSSMLGFTELIRNQSTNVIMFYGLLAVFLLWKLGDFLKESLDLIFT